MPYDNRKTSLYFRTEVLAELRAEAKRQDRSLSWLLQQAWRHARDRIMQLPSVK